MALVEWHDVPMLDESVPPDVDSDGGDRHESVPPNVDSDGEDRQERNDFNIEKDVDDFVDEPPIKHNIYSDTEDDEEGNEVQRTIHRRNNLRRGNGFLYDGQVFINGIAFKEAVLDYPLRTGYNIRQYRYDKTKLGFSCEGKGCSWRIYCSTSRKYNRWQVKVFKKDHACVPNGFPQRFP